MATEQAPTITPSAPTVPSTGTDVTGKAPDTDAPGPTADRQGDAAPDRNPGPRHIVARLVVIAVGLVLTVAAFCVQYVQHNAQRELINGFAELWGDRLTPDCFLVAGHLAVAYGGEMVLRSVFLGLAFIVVGLGALMVVESADKHFSGHVRPGEAAIRTSSPGLVLAVVGGLLMALLIRRDVPMLAKVSCAPPGPVAAGPGGPGGESPIKAGSEPFLCEACRGLSSEYPEDCAGFDAEACETVFGITDGVGPGDLAPIDATDDGDEP